MLITGIFKGLENGIFSLLLWIDSKIYGLISSLFNLYMSLAKAKIFTDPFYQNISQKIYVIFGVVALFVLAYTLLQGVANPDAFFKEGGNGSKVVKKLATAIILTALVPTIFNLLYVVQNAVLGDNIIPKLFLGQSTNTSSINNLDITCQNGMEEEITERIRTLESGEEIGDILENYGCTYGETKSIEYNESDIKWNSYGNEMALIVLKSFVNGNDKVSTNASDFVTLDTKLGAAGVGAGIACAGAIIITVATSGAGVFASLSACGFGTVAAGGAVGFLGATTAEVMTYHKYTWEKFQVDVVDKGSFSMLSSFADKVSDGSLNYIPVVSTICGIIVLYMLFSFCLDLGIRAAKLAYYQMMAPICFMADVIPGKNKDLTGTWTKKVVSTWLEVFIRIICVCSIVYLISNLGDVDGGFLGSDANFIAKGIIVMGLIIFAKQVPKLICDMLGIEGGDVKLGIMAKLGAGGALAAGAFIGGGLTAGLRNGVNNWKAARAQNKSGWKALGAGFKSGIAGFGSGAVRSAKSAGLGAKSVGDVTKAVSTGATAATTKRDNRAARNTRYKANKLDWVSGHITDAYSSAEAWATGGSAQFDAQIKLGNEAKAFNDDMDAATEKIMNKYKTDAGLVDTGVEFKGSNSAELDTLFADYNGMSLAAIEADINRQKSITDFSTMIERSQYATQDDYNEAIEKKAREHANKVANLESMYAQLFKSSREKIRDEIIAGKGQSGTVRGVSIDKAEQQAIFHKFEEYRDFFEANGSRVVDPVSGETYEHADFAKNIDKITKAYENMSKEASVKAAQYKRAEEQRKNGQ